MQPDLKKKTSDIKIEFFIFWIVKSLVIVISINITPNSQHEHQVSYN